MSMQIMLLGTGSADGWPNPFCECSSCTTERVAGRIRRPSSALIDDVILIDCGPTAPHAAGAAGRSLRAVQHVLITHGHPDHLDPAFLLARQWTDATSSLAVWGPPGAIDLCRDWIAPGAPVVLNVLAPGDPVTLATDRGDYDLLALPAAHSSGDGDALAEEALLYELTAANGHRLLYATDTGPLPASTMQLMDRPIDVLILDQTFGDHHGHGTGHLDLGTFIDLHETLADAGVTTSATQVVATHLSHHNPTTPQLRARLRVHGVIVPDDLDVIESRAASERNPLRLLILGGARSGKSTHAENAAKLFGQPVTYVATAAPCTVPAGPRTGRRWKPSTSPESWLPHPSVTSCLSTASRSGSPESSMDSTHGIESTRGATTRSARTSYAGSTNSSRHFARLLLT
jgi:adenosylcobinamide kinase/adenosylcobinamide-phosphate guanylyltransferase